jgi:hypothetical protein
MVPRAAHRVGGGVEIGEGAQRQGQPHRPALGQQPLEAQPHRGGVARQGQLDAAPGQRLGLALE